MIALTWLKRLKKSHRFKVFSLAQMNTFTAADQDRNITIMTNVPPKVLLFKWSAARLQIKQRGEPNILNKIKSEKECVYVCVWVESCKCEKGVWVTSRTNFNNMSLFPGPDHPTTMLNADELVAMTTGQPQRPWGYSSSGVMAGVCVCLRWHGVKGFRGQERGAAQLHFLCMCLTVLIHASAATCG